MQSFNDLNPTSAGAPPQRKPSLTTTQNTLLRPLIYLGPSLSLHEARQRIEANFAAPIVRGDLVQAIQKGYRWIGIIDGAFHQMLSVSIQEIHWALRQGAKLYGSSSMGALRAVETRTIGMVGIGKVYEWYLTEKIDADDEVAICFDEKTGKVLSEPLVNIRATLEKAEAQGIINPIVCQQIFEEAEALHFSERSYAILLKKLQRHLPESTIRLLNHFFKNETVDLKGEDAKQLLARIKEDYDHAIHSRTIFDALAPPD